MFLAVINFFPWVVLFLIRQYGDKNTDVLGGGLQIYFWGLISFIIIIVVNAYAILKDHSSSKSVKKNLLFFCNLPAVIFFSMGFTPLGWVVEHCLDYFDQLSTTVKDNLFLILSAILHLFLWRLLLEFFIRGKRITP
jgi:hypothetical protein